MGMAFVESPLLNNVRNAVVRVTARQHEPCFDHYAVSQEKLASLTAYNIVSDPISISRSPENILEDHIADGLLHVQLEGTARIFQGSNNFILRENALAIVPGGVPYRVEYPEHGSKIILRIPYGIFRERILGREIHDFGATQFHEGLVPIVISLLKSLTFGGASRLTDIDQFTLAESFLSMIGSIVRLRGQSEVREIDGNQSARIYRILTYIENNFSDNELTPARIAEANFVSIRHLHGLFRQRGTTVGKWLWDRRLRASSDDLLDASKASMTICEIAYSRGFNDSAHFSRSFKCRFGISPSEFRNKARNSNCKSIT